MTAPEPPRFPLADRFTVGERCVMPGHEGSYPSHARDKWGHVTEIRQTVKTILVEELIVTFDGEEPRAINPDVIAHGNDWRYEGRDPKGQPEHCGLCGQEVTRTERGYEVGSCMMPSGDMSGWCQTKHFHYYAKEESAGQPSTRT